MNQPSVQTIKIDKYQNHSFSRNDDLVAVEEPMEIRLEYGKQQNRKVQSLAVTMRTPGNDFELAVGFLFTEGIITSPKQLLNIRYCTDNNTLENNYNIVRVALQEAVVIDFDKLKRNFYTTSSCGVCGKESIESVQTVCPIYTFDNAIKVKTDLILSLPALLRKKQQVFEYTGGIHAAALFNIASEIILMREDVGRHNALDKLIGAALMNKMTFPLEENILLLSGRASFELIQKAAMAGIKIICAVGAPSSLAVNLASQFGITLIGFLREDRFNVYTHKERVVN